MRYAIIATLCAASVGFASPSARAADTITAVNGGGNTPNGPTPTGTVQFFDGPNQAPAGANAAPGGSRHTGGVNVLFGDGSVRFNKPSLDKVAPNQGGGQAPNRTVKLPDVLVSGYQTGGSDNGTSNASGQPGTFGFAAYDQGFRGGVHVDSADIGGSHNTGALRNVSGANFVPGDGSVRGLQAGIPPAIPVPDDQKAKFGSLNGVDGVDKLFLNSRGGDQTTGLLLPAVSAAREAGRGASNGSSAQNSVSRNGNLQITQFYHGSSQPSGSGGAGKTPTQGIITSATGAPNGHVKATDGTRTPSGPVAGGGSPPVKTYLAPSNTAARTLK